MKKYWAILLVFVLLVVGSLFAYALAEATEPVTPAAPLVDLTGVVVAVALAAFDFLLAWIARVIVPPIKEWLGTHTTEKQRGLLWDAICKLVDAAENTIRGPGQGEKKLAYVEAGLQQRGFTIDNDLIEAAVKRMNDRLAFELGQAFTVTPEQMDAVTEALEKVAAEEPQEAQEPPQEAQEAEESAEGVKDYCELDEDGNAICEAPQSVIE